MSIQNSAWRFVLGAIALALFPAPASAQRAPFPIPDPDPEVERRSFVVADGFEVNLYAADPMIHKPIQMNFDPQGRLWIASSEIYPQIKPGQVANDKILVVEDTNGDGTAEKTTVFADGLLIPTAVEPGDGGAYVGASTELLHLKDRDGDGRADETRVMLSGFGTEDTHHILHTLRWGHDGYLYFNQSIYIHSHIETPWGVRRLGGGGIWRFQPRSMELGVFIRGLVNPWGHHSDDYGQSFATDGAGGEGINYCLPGAYYFTAPGAVRVLPGLNPGSPKYCGLERISGRHLPESWQGDLITNDFRGNRVCRFKLSDDGAGFAARELPELIKTRHVAFRPIDVKMGPDGAIYIADWYNPIIQHGEVDFRDARRDHTRGRIWRVTAKGRPLVPRPRLVNARTEDLLEALRAPEEWTRRQAKRVLAERGAPRVLPALDAWVGAIDPHDASREHDRLEALWAYQALGRLEAKLLASLLQSNDPRVRAAAVRAASLMPGQIADPVPLLAPYARDPNPRVRLEAARALAAVPSAAAAREALAAVEFPRDRFLEYATWLTARELAPHWLPRVLAGKFDFDGKTRRLVYACLAVSTPEVVSPLLTLLQQGKVPSDQQAAVEDLAANLGNARDLAVMLEYTLTGKVISPARQRELVANLERAAKRGVRPAGDLTGIARLFPHRDTPLAIGAIRLAGAWHRPEFAPALTALLAREDLATDVRAAAIDALVKEGGAEGQKAVERLLEGNGSAAAQARVLAALVDRDPAAVMPRLVKWLAARKVDQLDPTLIVFSRVLDRTGAAQALAHGLDATAPALDSDLAKLLLRKLRTIGRDEPALARALERAGRFESAHRVLTAAQLKDLLAEVAQHGNPARGEAVFRRAELGCLKCHAISGAGGQVGPGLESIGASAQVDYLIESILEPSKMIKENYHSLVVATNDGKIHTGIKIRENDAELVLRDAEGAEDAIPTSEIDGRKQGASLMPQGLVDLMTHAELVDLVRFLSELGKLGAYATSTERVFRAWNVLEPPGKLSSAELAAMLSGDQGPGWKQAYATVAGRLPLVESALAQPRGPGLLLARAQFELTTPGAIRVAFNSLHGVTVFLDGKMMLPKQGAQNALELELERGMHTLGLAVDRRQRHDDLRATLEDLPGSKAQARVILGR